jgi:hypothetical protein
MQYISDATSQFNGSGEGGDVLFLQRAGDRSSPRRTKIETNDFVMMT